MTTEEKKYRSDNAIQAIKEVASQVSGLIADINALREAIYYEAEVAHVEEEKELGKITGRGPTIYKIGSKSYVEIPELMDFIKEEKRNFMEGTRPGYIEPKLKRRVAAMLALNKLQTVILRNELDKCRTPDQIREVTRRYRKQETEL